jgi:hypothetical protein
VVVHRFDGAIDARECSRETGCGRPLVVEPAREPEGPLHLLLERIAEVFGRRPEEYYPLMSRGRTGWSPSVLPLYGDTVDLAPLLRAMPAEALSLRFDPLPGQPGRVIGPVDLEWQPDMPARLTAEGLAPGLYRLVSLRSPARETWILLRPADRAAADAARLSEVTETARRWGPDEAYETDAFLRACLRYLALQP